MEHLSGIALTLEMTRMMRMRMVGVSCGRLLGLGGVTAALFPVVIRRDTLNDCSWGVWVGWRVSQQLSVLLCGRVRGQGMVNLSMACVLRS